MTARRILVTGSHNWTDRDALDGALQEIAWEYGYRHLTVVHGDCPSGADRLADEWATSNTALGVRVERHPADWDRHGHAAGPLRNLEMVKLGADICLAFPLPDSRGTVHCMAAARAAGIPVRVVAP